MLLMQASLLMEVYLLNYTIIRGKTPPPEFVENINRVSEIINGYCKSVCETSVAPGAGSAGGSRAAAGAVR